MRVHKVPGKGFYSRVGDFFGPLRATANQAIEALVKELEAYHPLNHTYVVCVDGTVLHLCETPSHGWNIYVIHPTGYIGEGIGVQGTFTEAKERATMVAVESFGGVRA